MLSCARDVYKRQVRAPSEMPVEDSTKVVTVEVPSSAPTQVAAASAISARSPPGRLPSLSSMPEAPAVPSSVPTVSKQSHMAKVITAVSRGSTPMANRPEKDSLKNVGAMEMPSKLMLIDVYKRQVIIGDGLKGDDEVAVPVHGDYVDVYKRQALRSA